jgi:hypothetical protein
MAEIFRHFVNHFNKSSLCSSLRDDVMPWTDKRQGWESASRWPEAAVKNRVYGPRTEKIPIAKDKQIKHYKVTKIQVLKSPLYVLLGVRGASGASGASGTHSRLFHVYFNALRTYQSSVIVSEVVTDRIFSCINERIIFSRSEFNTL